MKNAKVVSIFKVEALWILKQELQLLNLDYFKE